MSTEVNVRSLKRFSCLQSVITQEWKRGKEVGVPHILHYSYTPITQDCHRLQATHIIKGSTQETFIITLQMAIQCSAIQLASKVTAAVALVKVIKPVKKMPRGIHLFILSSISVNYILSKSHYISCWHISLAIGFSIATQRKVGRSYNLSRPTIFHTQFVHKGSA